MHKSTLNIWIFYFYKIVSFIATAVMALEWPEYMQMTSPADMSHSLAVLSDDPVRMKEESAENAASQIQLVWPESVEDKLIELDCLSIDQVLIKPSDPMVTSTLKMINQKHLTMLLWIWGKAAFGGVRFMNRFNWSEWSETVWSRLRGSTGPNVKISCFINNCQSFAVIRNCYTSDWNIFLRTLKTRAFNIKCRVLVYHVDSKSSFK